LQKLLGGSKGEGKRQKKRKKDPNNKNGGGREDQSIEDVSKPRRTSKSWGTKRNVCREGAGKG